MDYGFLYHYYGFGKWYTIVGLRMERHIFGMPVIFSKYYTIDEFELNKYPRSREM